MSKEFWKARVLSGFSQWELAKITGVHQSRISLIENDLADPTEEEKKKLAKGLGKKVEQVFRTAREVKHERA